MGGARPACARRNRPRTPDRLPTPRCGGRSATTARTPRPGAHTAPPPTPKPDLRRTALRYAAAGIAVMPLHTPRPGGVCSCRKLAGCSSPGKHPRLRHGLTEAAVRTTAAGPPPPHEETAVSKELYEAVVRICQATGPRRSRHTRRYARQSHPSRPTPRTRTRTENRQPGSAARTRCPGPPESN